MWNKIIYSIILIFVSWLGVILFLEFLLHQDETTLQKQLQERACHAPPPTVITIGPDKQTNTTES